jgi:hypothetical protein
VGGFLTEAFELPGYVWGDGELTTSNGEDGGTIADGERLTGVSGAPNHALGSKPKSKRGLPYWLSWAFSGVCLCSGLQAALVHQANGPPPVIGIGVIAAGLTVTPPFVVGWRRRFKFFRPIWAPPALAFGMIITTAMVGVIATMPEPPTSEVTASSAPQPAPPPKTEGDELDEALFSYPSFARKLLSDRLRDPQSAKITKLMAFMTGKRLTLCGMVNAKNGFGGYSGGEVFIISDDGIFIGETEANADRVFAECKGTATRTVPESALGN